MMLSEESEPTRHWQQVGIEALEGGIERIVMILFALYSFF